MPNDTTNTEPVEVAKTAAWLDYIGELSKELRDLASDAQLNVLAFLFDMAVTEVEKLKKTITHH